MTIQIKPDLDKILTKLALLAGERESLQFSLTNDMHIMDGAHYDSISERLSLINEEMDFYIPFFTKQ